MSRRLTAAVLVLAAGAGTLTGCSTSPEASSTSTTVVYHRMAQTMTSPVKCVMHMPGDLLSATDAVVVFDREHVCLGYVTVLADTPIMWQNADELDHTVTITDEDGNVVHRIDVPAGASVTGSVGTEGIYFFKLTAIDSFTGTIEVQVP